MRKLDPGPLFPWKRLAQEGLGVWPDERLVAQRQAQLMNRLPAIGWFQQQLAILGYKTPRTGELDAETRHVLAAFQMRYRPARFDGEPDAQSAAILQVLNRSN
jgi:N-acetylmuramoyl-L-alanine amidase